MIWNNEDLTSLNSLKESVSRNGFKELPLPCWEGSMLPVRIEPISGKSHACGNRKIWLEDGSMFFLYASDIHKWNICENCILEGFEYTELMQTLCKRARAKAMELLKDRDRTEQDIRSRLCQKGYPEKVVEEAIAYLYHYHYLDDERYIAQYVFHNRRRKSTRQIVQELRQKGLPEDLIAQGIDGEANEEENKEAAAARMLYEKYSRRKSVDDFQGKQKAMAYLMNKGFSWDTVRAIVMIEDTM